MIGLHNLGPGILLSICRLSFSFSAEFFLTREGRMASEARFDGPGANLIQPAEKVLALRSLVVQNAASAGRLDHCDITSDRAEIGRIVQ